MPYIYKITNQINNKIYIGKTSLPSIIDRWKEHVSDSKSRNKEKRPLYEAFKKYGIENFTIEEIEEVKTDDEACNREIYWIKKLNTYIGFDNSNGYNATLGGDSRRIYDYKELAQAYLELGTIKAVKEKYHCDAQTVSLACKENNIKIKRAVNQKRIKRIDDKNEIKIYSSVTEAAKDFPNKAIETARKNISRALNAKTKAYGYHWELIE